MTTPTLSVSIVVYREDRELLSATLGSLEKAANYLVANTSCGIELILINNGEPNDLEQWVNDWTCHYAFPVKFIQNADNIGYGMAHNQAILSVSSKYHLILNPDVTMKESSLQEAVDYLEAHSDVVALTPNATGREGEKLYLCKRYPSLLILLLRGFMPAGVKSLFENKMHQYECRDEISRSDLAGTPQEVDLISGCFMCCRTEALKRTGGFSEKYFLYFEDFALSMELSRSGRLIYLPFMSVRHYGGEAAKKGWRHIRMFASSALRFFYHYGWKFY